MSTLLIIACLIFGTLAWAGSIWKAGIRFPEFFTTILSLHITGKNRLWFAVNASISTFCICLNILILNNPYSVITVIVLAISACLFIIFDVQKHEALHTIAAATCYFLYSFCSFYLRGATFFGYIALLGFIITVIQFLLKKGDGLGLLITAYAATLALL